MAAADKTKLDCIEAGAQVHPVTTAIVSALNAVLGGDAWQQGGSSGAFTLAALVTASADGTEIAVESNGYVPFDSVVHPASSPPVTVSGGEITLNIIGSFLVLALTGGQFTTANVKGYVPVTLQTTATGLGQTTCVGIGVLSISGSSTNLDLQNAHECVADLLISSRPRSLLHCSLPCFPPGRGGRVLIYRHSWNFLGF